MNVFLRKTFHFRPYNDMTYRVLTTVVLNLRVTTAFKNVKSNDLGVGVARISKDKSFRGVVFL